MAWLYSAGILLVGIGLHTFLKRWTTLGVMVLFVMLNFTSSGGIFRPELQPGFFGSLHAFWNGAGFVEGVRSHVYFDGYALGGHVLVLALWLVAGLVVMGVAGPAEAKRRSAAADAQGAAGSRHRAGAESRSVAASGSGPGVCPRPGVGPRPRRGEELEEELERDRRRLTSAGRCPQASAPVFHRGRRPSADGGTVVGS